MHWLRVAFVSVLGSALALGPVHRRQEESTAYAPHTIDQPIDHFPQSDRYKPHTKDTFKQRYYFDDRYYKEGGPVFLYIGGETSGPSRFANLQTGIIQILMQATNGLGVILENRYYGESFPYNTSTTDQLAYLTTEQTIADNDYFARHAVFPGVNNNKPLNAPQTPWILYGGSLAGAQTAFSIKTYPKTLYAGISASGTTLAVHTYPEWYNPIQTYAPQDCMASVNAILEKYDRLREAGNRAAVDKFKALFGLQDLKDDRDFAMTIAFPLGGPMNYDGSCWQELLWDPKQGSRDFFYFCDNVTNIDAPEAQRKDDYALAEYTQGQPWTNLGNYAAYFKRVYLPYCKTGDINSPDNGCFGTQSPSYWANVSNTATRSYLYSACTEQGAYQASKPTVGSYLLSTAVQADYTQQWCKWAFPKGKYNSIPATPDLYQYNKYGGLNVDAERLAFIDGDQDVWTDLCHHSSRAPRRNSSIDASRPELLITGSGHHWDSYGILDIEAEPQFIREAHKWEIRQVRQWLRTFPKWKPGQ